MRVLLVADIHANWPALAAIAEPHDLCLCLGDLVEYGVEPAPCVEWVRQHARYSVRGNHDHGAAQDVVIRAATGFKYLTAATRPLTRERLRPVGLRFLADLPVSRSLRLAGQRFLLVHATPRDPLDEFAPGAADFWGPRLAGIGADIVCVGHTHTPYVLAVGRRLVINPGSVGLPRDGDPRASYAVWEDGRVEMKRISYPVEETLRALADSPLPEPAKRVLGEVYRTGRLAESG